MVAVAPLLAGGSGQAGQARTPGAAYTTPRTPWGDPDLQGVWTTDDGRSTPLQRPAEFGDRLSLTEAEFAERKQRDDETRGDTRAGAGTFVGEVGTRTLRQTSLVVEPADGRIPNLTAGAQRLAASRQAAQQGRGPADSWEDRSMMERCISRGVLGILPSLYGNGLRIVQSAGYVAINYEMIHDTRVIPIRAPGAAALAAPDVHSYMGASTGRWEGDTLVVESTHFTDRLAIARAQTGDALRLTERFTRVSPETIDYEVTIDDPETWVRPWKVLVPLSTQPGYRMFPFECHEGNYALRNILAGAREEERAIQEALGKGLPPPPPPPPGVNILPADPSFGRQR
jgi:hypothetical protein